MSTTVVMSVRGIAWMLCCFFGLAVMSSESSDVRAQAISQEQSKQNLTPIPPEVSLGIHAVGGLQGVGPVAISPDGQLLVTSVCDSREKRVELDPRYKAFTRTGVPTIFEGCELLIMDVRTGESHKILRGGASWFPIWSPDGRKLAFYSDHDGVANLWVWESKSQSVRRVSSAIIRSAGRSEPQWMPDSMSVIATVLPEGMSIDAAANLALGDAVRSAPTATHSSVVVYSSRPGAKSENSTSTSAYDVSQFFGDLIRIDLQRGTKKVIAAGVKCWGYRIAPDGKALAYTNQTGFTANTHHVVYDLLLYSFSTGRTSRLLQQFELPDGRSFSWSPDSTKLSYCAGYPKLDCYVINREGGSPLNITPVPHPPFAGADRPPLWSSDGQNTYRVTSDGLWKLSVGGKSAIRIATIPEYDIVDFAIPYRTRQLIAAEDNSVVVIARNRKNKRMAFCRVDLVTGEVRNVHESEEFIGGFYPRYALDITSDSRAIVYCSQDGAHPPEIWMVGSDFKNPHQLTHINSEVEQYTLGKARLLEWHGSNGDGQGVVLFPPAFDEQKKYPVIVVQYPGDRMSDSLNQYGLSGIGGVEDMQLFATRGYIVFLPDTPQPEKLNPMRSILDGLLPGLDRLAELNGVDTNRMGIMGASYGGYAVLSITTQTKKFKAAVARSSQGDMVGAYGYMRKNGDTFSVSWAETGQGGMGGTPWEHRDRYIENSPFYYLDRVETPLLLIHGSEDPAVPSFLADQTFVGLRRLGKEVEYARYEGEGHAENGWGYANQLDYINRVIAWFDKYLKAPESPMKVSR